VAAGADALGMAGGDGSLAVVAAVAAAHGIPFVCVPAGTRNHFALDVGVDRHDVIGALDAFTDGVERQIDMAEVNGRAFLNNASLGIYGDAVRSPAYREAKVRTLLETAAEVMGPGVRQRTRPGGRRHTQRHGARWSTAQQLRCPVGRCAQRGHASRVAQVHVPGGSALDRRDLQAGPHELGQQQTAVMRSLPRRRIGGAGPVLGTVPLGEPGQRAPEPIAGKHERLAGGDCCGYAGSLV
jgi:Diacylglycerol kinase catalytic domain